MREALSIDFHHRPGVTLPASMLDTCFVWHCTCCPCPNQCIPRCIGNPVIIFAPVKEQFRCVLAPLRTVSRRRGRLCTPNIVRPAVSVGHLSHFVFGHVQGLSNAQGGLEEGRGHARALLRHSSECLGKPGNDSNWNNKKSEPSYQMDHEREKREVEERLTHPSRQLLGKQTISIDA